MRVVAWFGLARTGGDRDASCQVSGRRRLDRRQEAMMTRIVMRGAIISAAIGFALSALAWCRADEPGQVCEFKLDWPDRMHDGAMLPGATHEIIRFPGI